MPANQRGLHVKARDQGTCQRVQVRPMSYAPMRCIDTSAQSLEVVSLSRLKLQDFDACVDDGVIDRHMFWSPAVISKYAGTLSHMTPDLTLIRRITLTETDWELGEHVQRHRKTCYRRSSSHRSLRTHPWGVDDTSLPEIVRLSTREQRTHVSVKWLIISYSALYANKFNTLFYHDVNDAEQFGFLKGQVTPFNIQTPDGQTLYAWHVLPIDISARNEQLLRGERRLKGPLDDVSTASAFKLLAEDPAARVVVSCEYIQDLCCPSN